MNTNQFDFAKQNKPVTQDMVKECRFYMVDGVTSVVSHGDIEDFDRLFLIAAPTEEHAKTWVELNYLMDSVCNTHQDLIDEINELTVKDDEADCLKAQFMGCVDVGGYKYRRINRLTEITEEATKQMLKLGNFYQTNLAINALN